jgi:hypothetical protein
MGWRDAAWWLWDRIWPCVQRSEAEERQAEKRRSDEVTDCERRVAQLPDDPVVLEKRLDDVAALLADEGQRRQSVDARLTMISGLFSIAGTVVFGGLLTGALRVTPLWLYKLILAYMALQIGVTLFAGIRGLGRRSYDEPRARDVLPGDAESLVAHLRQRIIASCGRLEQHRCENNRKVTDMAIAHRAMKNFVWGFLVLAALAVASRHAEAPLDDVADRLQKDRHLRDLLRGPQGVPGPPGNLCVPCVTGQEEQAPPRHQKIPKLLARPTPASSTLPPG